MHRYYTQKSLDPFHYLPETYLVPLKKSFEEHINFKCFRKVFKEGEMWIYKPGESSNRGNGIKVFNNL